MKKSRLLGAFSTCVLSIIISNTADAAIASSYQLTP